MDEDQNHLMDRILHLTLEIIYLLTGERFPLLKSDDHMTITVPPCDSLNPERHNMQKILEVTKMMMELLTGEVRSILGHFPVADTGGVWMVTNDGQSATPHITGWIQSWEPTRGMSPSSVFPGFHTGRS
ncbi:unnamed protein product, partial [Staurois parvus]